MWDFILGTSAMIFVVLPAIVGATIVMGLKVLKGGASTGRSEDSVDETQTIQEIYKGLARMEERVDTLETILLDRSFEKEEKK